MAEFLDGSQYLETHDTPAPAPPIQDFKTGTQEHSKSTLTIWTPQSPG